MAQYGTVLALFFLLYIDVVFSSYSYLVTTYMPYGCSDGKTKNIYVNSMIFGTGSSGIISMSGTSSVSSANCSIVLHPPTTYSGIIITTSSLNLRYGYDEKLTISDGYKFTVLSADNTSGGKTPVFISDRPGKPVTIRYTSASQFSGRYSSTNIFDLVYTAYVDKSYCSSFYYKCDNRRCIADELICDGYNHCGDRSDQKHSVCYPSGTSIGAKVGYTFGGIFLLIAIACLVVLLIRKQRRATTHSGNVIHPPPTHIPGTCVMPPHPSLNTTVSPSPPQYGGGGYPKY